jgi:hypothetical protein
MFGILHKLDNGYMLLVDNIIYATDNDKLSNKNCDEIFGIFDIENLIEESYEKHRLSDDKYSLSEQIQRSGGFSIGYEEGFNKKTELDKDKLFTAKDMFEAIMLAVAFESCGIVGVNTYNELKELAIERALKPTEIEVEIVTESLQVIVHHGDMEFQDFTKLDKDGCLILKRK